MISLESLHNKNKIRRLEIHFALKLITMCDMIALFASCYPQKYLILEAQHAKLRKTQTPAMLETQTPAMLQDQSQSMHLLETGHLVITALWRHSHWLFII